MKNRFKKIYIYEKAYTWKQNQMKTYGNVSGSHDKLLGNYLKSTEEELRK